MNNEPDLMPEGIDPVINGSDFAEQKLNHRNAKPRPSPPTDPQHEASVNPKVQTQAELRTDPQFIADANRWYNAAYDAEQAIRSRQNSDIISQTPDGKAHEAPERLLSESEIVDWAIEGASRFNWNLTGALIDYNVMRKRPVGDVRAMMGVIDRYSASENTMDTTGRALKYLATDPLTYIGVGLVAKGVVHGGTSAAGKGYLRNLLGKAVTNPAVIGAVEGGVYTGAFASAEEDLQAKAQERDFNATIPMIATGIGAGLGVALGAAVPAIKWGWPKMVKLFRGGEKAGNSFTDSPAAAATHGPVAEHEVEVRSPAILPEVTTLDEVADHFNLDEAQTERLAAAVSDADAVDNLFERQLGALNDRLDATNEAANKALDSAQLPDAATLPEVNTPGATPLPQASLPNAPELPGAAALPTPPSLATPVLPEAAALPDTDIGAEPGLPTPTLPTGGVSRTPIETSKLMQVEGVQEVLKDAGADMVVYPERSPQIQQRLNAPKNEIGMFSQIEDVLLNKNAGGWHNGGQATGAQILKTLQRNGVKREELEWTGLGKRLKDNPDEKFSREDVQAYLDDHKVRVEEVVAESGGEGADAETFMDEVSNEVWDDPEAWEYRTESDLYEWDNQNKEWLAEDFFQNLDVDDYPELEGKTAEEIDEWVFANLRDEFEEYANEQNKISYFENEPIQIIELNTGDNNPNLYLFGNDEQGYSLRKGGWLYHEDSVEGFEAYNLDEAMVQARLYANDNLDVPYGETETIFETSGAYQDAPYENYREIKITLPDNPDTFNGGHFGEENVVAHLLTSDRELIVEPKIKGQPAPTPKKVYFIEEAQSDWHRGDSGGSKLGYETPITRQKAIDARSAVNANQEEMIAFVNDKFGEYASSDGAMFSRTYQLPSEDGPITLNGRQLAQGIINIAEGQTDGSRNLTGSVFELIESKVNKDDAQKYLELDKKSYDLREALHATGREAPNAPFKDDAWLALTMKRAMIEAAEQGYEYIAWSNGATVKSRWSDVDHSPQYDQKMPVIAGRLTGSKPSQRLFDVEATGSGREHGYWAMKITPEAKDRATGKGYPLFSMSSLIAGVTASMAAPYEAEAASEESSLDPDGTSMTYRVLDKSLLDQEKLGAE